MKVAIVDNEIHGTHIEIENVYVNVVEDIHGNSVVSEKIAKLLGITELIEFEPKINDKI